MTNKPNDIDFLTEKQFRWLADVFRESKAFPSAMNTIITILYSCVERPFPEATCTADGRPVAITNYHHPDTPVKISTDEDILYFGPEEFDHFVNACLKARAWLEAVNVTSS